MLNITFNLKNGTRFFTLLFPVYYFVASQFFAPQPENTPATALGYNAPSITVNVSSNSPLCAGNTLTLAALPASGIPPYTFTWSGPAGYSANTQNPNRPNVTLAHAGNYHVTVTDDSGATGTGSVAVEVFAPPTANAGPDQILCKGATANLNGSVGASASAGTWSASVPGGTFTPNNAALNAAYKPPTNFVGSIILTLTTNDPAGPCTPASDQVTLTYGDPEALVCNDLVSISLDEDCSVTLTPDMLLEGDVQESLYSVNVYTVSGQNLGNTVNGQYLGATLKAKVTDNCTGNYCFTDVTIGDNIPPLMKCKDIFLPCVIKNYAADYMYNQLGIADAYPAVTENCSLYTLTSFDTWVDVACGGSFNGYDNISGYVKRIWTAQDPSGNKSHCTQYIYFQRLGIYDLKFPQDVTVSCEMLATNPMATGTPYYEAFGQAFSLHPDNGFCELTATFEDQTVKYCEGQASIIRTWTIYDLCKTYSPTPPQNPYTFIQFVNIVDQQGPIMACPSNMTITTDPTACCATVNLPDIILEDVCSTVRDVSAVILTFDPLTGDTTNVSLVKGELKSFPGNNLSDKDTLAVFGETPCLPTGKHTILYIAEDMCGSSSTCSFKITVSDNTPPLAVCVEYTQVSLGIDGMILVNATSFDNGSYDNCGPVYFKARRVEANACQSTEYFYDQVKFCCSDLNDTILVQLRVYDEPLPLGPVDATYLEQHSNDCMVQVYVDDKLKPICVAPPNTTVSCENFDPSLWAYGMGTAIDNCCVDTVTVSNNYSQFDTLCNKGTIVRTFRAFDCQGLSNQCTQRVYVNYEQDYYVKFPNDAVVTVCNGPATFGEPTFFGKECELLGVAYEDEVFTVVPDACMKIERTWTIINWCTYNPNLPCVNVPNPNPNATANHPTNLAGPIVSAAGTPAPWSPTVVKINPTDQSATNYSIFWDPDVNCYKYKQIIKITDTQKPVIQCPTAPVEYCDLTPNDAQFWNESYWWDANCATHDLCEGPVDLCITATDGCSGSNIDIRYILFLDLDGDGTMETVISSSNPPAPNEVRYNNANTPNFSGGAPRAFDERNVPLNQKWRFGIQNSVSGTNKTACVRWNTLSSPNSYEVPHLPYGNHKIKWIVQDGCGNESVCEYSFTVKDCKGPTVVCHNGLSTNIMQTGMISLDASYFLQHKEDNCTPSNMLIVGIRKAGTGTGFPLNLDATPQTQVTFDCTELGTQEVEIWAKDKAGNTGYCQTYVIVQNINGACGNNATVAGALKTEDDLGLEEVNVSMQGVPTNGLPPLSMFDMSDADGSYMFSNAIPYGSNYTVTPLKDDNPLNGVTTFDLVLISRHILGLQPLNTPYCMIAADVNKSNSITTFDVVELRKLILGVYDQLPNNTSWRFIDRAYGFKDPSNPFELQFPEMKTLASIQSSAMSDDFVAVKIGDVNTSAIPNSLAFTGDRSIGTLAFDVEDRAVKAGETFKVHFKAGEQVNGYQLTLNYRNLELVSVEPGVDMAADNFANFPAEQALTSSWDGAAKPEFDVVFKAKTSGSLAKMLAVSSRITKAEAYGEDDEPLDIALRFNNSQGNVVVAGVGFELYQNAPNPFINKTTISFHLPEETEAKLSVYDETGQVLYSQLGDFAKGYNAVVIDRKLLGASGVLYYKLETPSDSATRKMVQMN